MRTVSLALFGLAAILGTSGFVAVGNTSALVGGVSSPKGEIHVNRTVKGDRQGSVAVKLQAPKSAAQPSPTPGAKPATARLPDGCEPSVSPLANKAAGVIRARCIS